MDPQFKEIAAGSTSRLDLWVKILRAINAKCVLEVGVWKGAFAERILKECEQIEQYHMVDPWTTLPDWNKPLNVGHENFERAYQEAMQRTAFASNKIVVHRGRTNEVIRSIPESLDFAYIDGDHTLRGITIDLLNVLPKIKEGGFIGGDDFANDPWQHPPRFEPTLVYPFAVFFAEAMSLTVMALPFDQFLMQKRLGGSFLFLDTTGKYRDNSLNKLRFGLFNMGPFWWAKRAMKRASRALFRGKS